MSAVATLCRTCGRPQAAEQDWQTYGEGEGEHLCWDGMDAGCIPTDWPAEVERLRTLLGNIGRWLGHPAEANDSDVRLVIAEIERLVIAEIEQALAAAPVSTEPAP